MFGYQDFTWTSRLWHSAEVSELEEAFRSDREAARTIMPEPKRRRTAAAQPQPDVAAKSDEQHAPSTRKPDFASAA